MGYSLTDIIKIKILGNSGIPLPSEKSIADDGFKNVISKLDKEIVSSSSRNLNTNNEPSTQCHKQSNSSKDTNINEHEKHDTTTTYSSDMPSENVNPSETSSQSLKPSTATLDVDKGGN